MEGSEKFCLRWNDFETNISEGFRELRQDKDFFDVTLACEDDQIQAHRVIISACSPFFRNVLRRNPHQHPLLYLKGVKYRELLAILNFMYLGEVNVAQEELNSFLAVAEELKVKGLTQNNADSSEHKEPAKKEQQKQDKRQREITEELAPQMKKPKPMSVTMPSVPKPITAKWKKNEDHEIEEVAVVKTETFEPHVEQPSFVNSSTMPAQAAIEENQNANSVALDDSYGVDDTYDYQYDTAAYDSFAGVNTNTAGTEENKGTKSHPDKKVRQSNTQPSENKEAISLRPKAKPKEKEKKKPAHSYVRFGSAWQCEQCKTLFSRKTYASEHMQEHNEEL